MARDMTVVFGRVVRTAGLFSQDFAADLVEAVQPRQEHVFRLWHWVFGDVQSLQRLLVGRLGRYTPRTKAIVYDEAAHEFRREDVPVPEAHYSNFAIHLASHLICFEERKGSISIPGFLREFGKLAEFNGIAFEVNLLTEVAEVRRWLSTLDRVNRADFRVSRPNPVDEEEFRRVQALLEELNATGARLDFFNVSEGLNYSSDFFRELTNMSRLGFADFNIQGERMGGIDERSSRQKVLKRVLKDVEDEPRDVGERFGREMEGVDLGQEGAG